jgi:hypothetical protein
MTEDAFQRRKTAYEAVLGEVGELSEGSYPFDPKVPRVDVLGFERDFSTAEDETDEGWVLVTSGMSDRRMHVDEEAQAGEAAARAELIWYVREPGRELMENLRWVAQFPFIDDTWLGFGHTIPMPSPIIDGTALTTFFLLQPIIRRDRRLLDGVTIDGDEVATFVLHVLTQAEYELKRKEGTDRILELFDEHDYPLIFDPTRPPMV